MRRAELYLEHRIPCPVRCAMIAHNLGTFWFLPPEGFKFIPAVFAREGFKPLHGTLLSVRYLTPEESVKQTEAPPAENLQGAKQGATKEARASLACWCPLRREGTMYRRSHRLSRTQ